MPDIRLRYLRTTALLLLVGLAALLCIVGASVWLVQQTGDHLDAVVQARDVRSAAVDLRNALQDTESGQRGFLITREEQYLQSYEDARGAIEPALQRLERLLDGNPDRALWIGSLRENVQNKVAELDQTIAMAREGRFEAAAALVNTDVGKRYMDAARDALDAVLAATEIRVDEAVAREYGSVDALRWITIGGAVLIVVVAAGAAQAVAGYTREMLGMRRQLETTNLRLEERVVARTAQLADANEEIQRFAYIVTHDLRAPLVNIMGFTSELEASLEPLRASLESDPPDPGARAAALQVVREEIPEALGFIRSSTGRMDGLINAILRISRDGRRPLKPEPLELADILERAAGALQHQVAELDGEIAIDPALPSIVSDRLNIEQIFGNLLDNAVKYAVPDRPLRIRVTGHALPDGRLAVDVEDNGRGIAEQDHERVFELFRRSGEHSRPSEGIGLTHVRMLVRHLGGDIILRSRLGEGSTFRVVVARNLNDVIGSND